MTCLINNRRLPPRLHARRKIEARHVPFNTSLSAYAVVRGVLLKIISLGSWHVAMCSLVREKRHYNMLYINVRARAFVKLASSRRGCFAGRDEASINAAKSMEFPIIRLSPCLLVVFFLSLPFSLSFFHFRPLCFSLSYFSRLFLCFFSLFLTPFLSVFLCFFFLLFFHSVSLSLSFFLARSLCFFALVPSVERDRG